MKNEEHRRELQLRDQLFELARLDAAAVAIYDDALRHVDDEQVREAFELFKADHERHLRELPNVIQHIGWATPEFKVDFKGHLKEWGVTMRCIRGTTGVLHAMHATEKRHSSVYGEASQWELDDDELITLLNTFSEHERGHLAFVEEQLSLQ